MRSFVSQTLKYVPGIFFLFICSVSFAQLKADFTADQPAGCSPLLISFSNTTTGASANVTYKWDFGNGNSSTKKDAGATYFDEKTYTVTLTATDGTQASSKTMTITVYKKPTVNFNASPAKGCSPLSVTFTSSSTAGDGTIANYFWDFGDGSTQETSVSQISHTYNFAQKTNVSLTATNNHGCFNTLEKKQVVEVLGSMKAGFTANKTVLCAVNETTTFNNTSMGPGTLSYEWDFGDGKTSKDKNPTHAYDKKGIYTVTLTVKNSDGCLDKVVQTDCINVANYTVDFDVPSPVCENTQATFTDISTSGSSNTAWQVDGGYTYNYYGSYFYYTFNSPGSHKIKLTNTYGTCAASKEKSFTVNAEPKVDGFSSSFGTLCGVPVTIQFKDTTSGAKSWLWDFNSPYGNATATTQNPSYTYNSEGFYYVKLTVTNASGCSSSVTQSYRVGKPTVNVNYVSSTSPSGNSGCPGFTMTFAANVITGEDEITAYKWEFPDDGSTSTSSKPKHTFNKQGTYRIKLAYTTKNGCADVVYYDYVYVYEKPKADFVSLSGTTICGNTPVNFSDQSVGTVTNWAWDFGDYNSYYTGSPNAPIHQYYDTGKYTVTLIAYNGTCADTAIKENYIKVLPPFPLISGVMNTCDDTRGLVTFSQSSRYALSWKWDFGDGSTKTFNTEQTEITHAYAKTGTYKVILTATNGQCSVNDSATAYVLLKQNPKLNSSKTEVCSQDEIDITVNNLEKNPTPNYYYKYSINNLKYGDGSDFTGSVYPATYGWDTVYNGNMREFDNKKKDIYAIIYSEYFGCFDTTNIIPLLIKGPIPDYKITTDNVCYKSPVIIKDASKAQNGVAITKWDWDFGDGTSQSFSAGGTVSRVYSNPGVYYPTLTLTDADGCRSSTPYYYDYAEVNGPKASFYSSEQSVSPGTYIYFYNTTNTYNAYNTTYEWDFGDGITSTDYYPGHSYANTGVDTVKLFAADASNGCSDTAIQLIYVKNVNTSFTFITSYINNNSCPPLLAQFQNTSSNANYVSWNFGDGSVTDNQNFPSHTYYQPGTYKVTLYGYGDNNAIDSTVDYVTVKGPYATLSADVLNGCNSASVTLSAQASGATSYTWDFADGTLQQTTDTFGVHTYTNAGTFIPSLIMKDGFGCSATFSLKDTIVIDTLKIQSINKVPSLVCDSGFVLFNPTVVSIAADEMHKQLQYHWSFGTSNPADTSNSNQPMFFYNQLGKYAVKLKVTSPYGCINEFTDSINVVEKAKGTISGPAAICKNGSATFTGASTLGNVTWNWSFENGNISSSQNPSTQTFTEAKDYMVSLVVTHSGCSDTTYSKLTVHPVPNINILPKEPRICLGNSIQLTAHDATNYQWLPDQNISNNTSANPIVNPSATTRYFVKASNEFKCENTDSVNVVVVQPFTVQLDTVSYACKGIGVELHAEGADIYKWISGEGLSDYNISNPFTNPQATTAYTVVGYDKYGCFTDTATTIVEIKPLPAVTAAPDQVTLAGSTITLQANASSDVVSWNWDPPTYLSCTACASPESNPRSNITYTVTVTNNYNCTAKDSLNIKLICTESIVKIPNSFTPNHDALNDWFAVLGKGIKLVKHITVFNRWGQAVYRRDNIQPNDHSAGWDGKSAGIDMPSGVYVYIAEIICDTGDEFAYKGTVTLIR